MKRIETSHTVWLVDEDLKRFKRIPKSEDPNGHPVMPYDNDWHEYEVFIESVPRPSKTKPGMTTHDFTFILSDGTPVGSAYRTVNA